jgi:nitrogenase delta subunit
MEEALLTERVGQLTDYIMKHCLWQFQSRTWDRKNQNEGILGKATQILCGEQVVLETPADRCYWVDSVCLVDAFRERFEWLAVIDAAEMKEVMQCLHERMDYLTITGSLNLELTDQHY